MVSSTGDQLGALASDRETGICNVVDAQFEPRRKDALGQFKHSGSACKPPCARRELRCSDARAAVSYTQFRSVNLHLEHTGFSRLHQALDLAQLPQAFLRGVRGFFPGVVGVAMARGVAE